MDAAAAVIMQSFCNHIIRGLMTASLPDGVVTLNSVTVLTGVWVCRCMIHWFVIQEAQLSLTNRAMLVCKVVEVLQDFLSEYVDKKFTRDYNVILYLSVFNSFRVTRC